MDVNGAGESVVDAAESVRDRDYSPLFAAVLLWENRCGVVPSYTRRFFLNFTTDITMPKTLSKMMAEANAVIDTISVHDALTLRSDLQTMFIDVRESAERQKKGAIPGSLHVPRGFLEFIADPAGPMHKVDLTAGNKLVVYCATGGRSVLAAKTLSEMGVEHVTNLAGGFAAWVEAGGATEDIA